MFDPTGRATLSVSKHDCTWMRDYDSPPMIVRCYTCNNYLACHERRFVALNRERDATTTTRHILDALGLTRICCRTHMIAHVDLSRDFDKFSANDLVLDNIGSVFHRKVDGSRRVSCDTGVVEAVDEGGRRADVAED